MSANIGNVIGGNKVNLSNPNILEDQEESKQHSREVLKNADNGGEVEMASSSGGDKNPSNVAGGPKVTLNNPNTSDEAKQSAKEKLDIM